ncbi:hypothetical protein V6N13_103420 [Hibiscus sabdariffa]|uniref:Uncharacterized protein n=2 Tax=Hibiscus sabdariffa TaxID=183260 RepID=A0ABR2BHZ7_9ROSI
MGRSLVRVPAMLELAAPNVPKPSREAWALAFRLLSNVSPVNVPGPAPSQTTSSNVSPVNVPGPAPSQTTSSNVSPVNVPGPAPSQTTSSLSLLSLTKLSL